MWKSYWFQESLEQGKAKNQVNLKLYFDQSTLISYRITKNKTRIFTQKKHIELKLKRKTHRKNRHKQYNKKEGNFF